jgi:MGT family glycosyltransferase
MNRSLRFLLATWDGGGVVPPELGVARRLVARGHSVRVLADPVIEDEARAAGCEFSPWTTAPHRTTRDRSADVIKDYDGRSTMKLIDAYMDEFLGGPAMQWAGDTLAELEARPVDVFITDQVLPATSIAAEKLGLPRAALSPNVWMIPTPGLPPVGTGFAQAQNPFTRLRDVIVRSMMTRLFDKALAPLNAARAAHGLAPVASTYEQMLRVDATYVLTSPEFDFKTPHLPKNVHYAGPMTDDPSWSGSWKAPWPDDDRRPLVLVGFSSQFQDHAAPLQRVIDALSQMDVRAVVTLGTALREGEIVGTENVHVTRAAPHSELLKHAALLVTHGGHGTVMKGLAAGVPLVVMPVGRDQPDNAVRVTTRGAGERVKVSASSSSLRTVFERVLRDATYKEAARKLGDVIKRNVGCVDIVTSLESLAREPSVATRSAA